jgi:hypothetical protein
LVGLLRFWLDSLLVTSWAKLGRRALHEKSEKSYVWLRGFGLSVQLAILHEKSVLVHSYLSTLYSANRAEMEISNPPASFSTFSIETLRIPLSMSAT